MVKRTYYGVISDALEACFSFENGMDSEEYHINTENPPNESLHEALDKAIKIEEVVQKAYSDAATHSEGLMADLPRTFKIAAGRREKRIIEMRNYTKNQV